MTKRMYRIVYMSSVSDVPHEFTTDKLFEADERAKQTTGAFWSDVQRDGNGKQCPVLRPGVS